MIGVMEVCVDGAMNKSLTDVMHTIVGPEVLGEEKCQNVTYLGVALEIYQTPLGAVMHMVHQTTYAHNARPVGRAETICRE